MPPKTVSPSLGSFIHPVDKAFCCTFHGRTLVIMLQVVCSHALLLKSAGILAMTPRLPISSLTLPCRAWASHGMSEPHIHPCIT